MEDSARALQLRSAYHLRTYAVGSVLPMWCNKATSLKICRGLCSLLSETGPDATNLSALSMDGLALRAVSWKTSSVMTSHRSLMSFAGEDLSEPGKARVCVVDPTIDGFRSVMFMGLVRNVLGLDSITDDERNVILGAVLSLVSHTPEHASVVRGEWRETSVDMIAETRHLDGAHIIIIPPTDKATLIENITPNAAGPRPGWADAEDRNRALRLVEQSFLFMTGIRHIAGEKDNLLIDPETGDVCCTHDVAHHRTVIRGSTPGVLDVPLQMFTLHLAVVMAAATRIVARHSHMDRDTMMQLVVAQEAQFAQTAYHAKRVTRVPVHAKAQTQPNNNVKAIAELQEQVCTLQGDVVRCETRLASLEVRVKSPIRADEEVLTKALKRTRSHLSL